MSSQHKAPLAAFVLVAIACLVVLVQGIRGDAIGLLLRPSPSEMNTIGSRMLGKLPAPQQPAEHTTDPAGHGGDRATVPADDRSAGSRATHVHNAVATAPAAHGHGKKHQAAGKHHTADKHKAHGIRHPASPEASTPVGPVIPVAPPLSTPGSQSPAPGNAPGHANPGPPVHVSVDVDAGANGHGKSAAHVHVAVSVHADAPGRSKSRPHAHGSSPLIQLAAYGSRSHLPPGWEAGRCQHGHADVHSGWSKDHVGSGHGQHGEHGHH